MNLEELQKETSSLQQRYAAAESIDAKAELADNVLPLLEALIEIVGANFGEHDEAIDDMGDAIDQLMDQTEDVLHAETAMKFAAFVELAKMVAKILENNHKKLDDVTRQNSVKAIAAMRALAKEVTDIIAEITLPDAEDPPPADAEPADDGDPNDAGNGQVDGPEAP